MQHFITGLQFLTRIHIAKQTEWSSESFGRSVKFFPLIGGIVGILLMILSQVMTQYLPSIHIHLPPHVTTTLLIAANIILTGGLTCDGFMDTMDGIFSGRSKDRMLEIMKDSRVGANGVMAFVLLIILKWSLLMDLSSVVLPNALLIMPLLGRFAMLMGITAFPYARPDGMGKAFAQYAGRYTLYIGLFLTIVMLIPLGQQALLSLVAVSVGTILFARFVTHLLGGLTGDIYGAISELAEIMVLFVFLF